MNQMKNVKTTSTRKKNFPLSTKLTLITNNKSLSKTKNFNYNQFKPLNQKKCKLKKLLEEASHEWAKNSLAYRKRHTYRFHSTLQIRSALKLVLQIFYAFFTQYPQQFRKWLKVSYLSELQNTETTLKKELPQADEFKIAAKPN